MSEKSDAYPPLPPDDLRRTVTVATPGRDRSLPHIGLVGDTYTILVAGHDTAGKYTLIDMHVPPGGGPPPHRHDFEEMFTVLDGEVRVTFRGETIVARAGQTINVPANAPHSFTNSTGTPSRLLCLCAPAGQDEFFTLVGQPVATRTQAPPPVSPDEQAAFIAKSRNLAPRFKTELLPPPGADEREPGPARGLAGALGRGVLGQLLEGRERRRQRGPLLRGQPHQGLREQGGALRAQPLERLVTLRRDRQRAGPGVLRIGVPLHVAELFEHGDQPGQRGRRDALGRRQVAEPQRS